MLVTERVRTALRVQELPVTAERQLATLRPASRRERQLALATELAVRQLAETPAQVEMRTEDLVSLGRSRSLSLVGPPSAAKPIFPN
jgi:hypothetical protein